MPISIDGQVISDDATACIWVQGSGAPPTAARALLLMSTASETQQTRFAYTVDDLDLDFDPPKHSNRLFLAGPKVTLGSLPSATKAIVRRSARDWRFATVP